MHDVRLSLLGTMATHIGRFAARHRRNFLVRKVAKACESFLLSYENLDHGMQRNGELFVLRALARFDLRTVFDVGANVGDWTIVARHALPTAAIHAFEISEPTWRRLCDNTRHLDGIHCRNVGLADSERTVTIRRYDGLPALTTMYEYPHTLPFTEVRADVITGDSYAEGNGIERVDYLKVDVEGMEHLVLKGFSKTIERGAIDVIQFEYGRVSVVTRFLLCDYYRLLEGHGYVIGKLFPNYVDFREYDVEDEDFLGPNYVACRKEKVEYIRALRGR